MCDGGATLGKSYRRVAKKVIVDWRKKIASTGEKNCVDWRFAGETPALFAEQSAFGGCLAAQCSQVNRKSYHRLAFRRRDACAPGCAAFFSVTRKITVDWRVAGETPALLAALRFFR